MIPSSHSTAYSNSVFRPKLLTTLRGYGWKDLASDALAGVIVGMIALPLAIAFGIASGVTPERGLVTAIVAGAVVSALGGSRVQIGGPTGAFVVIVYKIVEQHGVYGLTAATLMAGAILILMGIARLGAVIKFVPYPVTVGFTSGIAVVIFSSQIPDLLGLRTGPSPADFVAKWRLYLEHIGTLEPATVALAAACLAVIVFWPRVSRRVPGPIVAIVAASIVARRYHLPVETIGTRFGELPRGLPLPTLPLAGLARWRELIGPAFTIAMLGSIESLLSATVADSMIGGRHRSNTELIGQGFANLASAVFGGIPATGAIARTATNVKNGGRTPIAGIVHAATLLSIVLLFGRWAAAIPLCALAAILVVVCYHMSEWRSFKALLRAPKSDVAVLLVTFFLTVLVDLTVAVEIGMLLAMALFLKRMSEVSAVHGFIGAPEPGTGGDRPAFKIPPGVAAYEAQGALVFGVVEQLRDLMFLGADPPKTLVLGMDDVLALDATALRALTDLHDACRRAGTRFMLAGVRLQPRSALTRAGLVERFGAENVAGEGLKAVLTTL